MLDSGIPDIAIEKEKAVQKVEQRFHLSLSEELAEQKMEHLIDESVNAKITKCDQKNKNFAEMLNSKDTMKEKLCDECFHVIQMALRCKHQKINQAAADLLQAIIRDKCIISETNFVDDSLPLSVLKSVALLPVIKAPIQCKILTLIVEVMCKEERHITTELVMEALTLCLQTYENAEETSVRLACRAAITQIFTSFCTLPKVNEKVDHPHEFIAVAMDVTSLLNKVIEKINIINPQSDQIVILLDAIYSILSSQPIPITKHQPFINVIWCELSPCLMKMLGEPEKSTRDTTEGGEPLGRGHRSLITRNKSIFDHPEIVLSLYQIVEQLLRLLSTLPGMRSVLEAIFHKALLYPPVDQRFEALRVIRKIVGNEERLADIVAVSVFNESLTLWTLIIDCILECSQSGNIELASECLRTLQTFLNTASRLCANDNDNVLSPELTSLILESLPLEITISETNSEKNLPNVCSQKLDSVEPNDTKESDIDRNNSAVNLEVDQILEKLSFKYNEKKADSSRQFDRSSCDLSCQKELNTATYFIKELMSAIPKWLQIKSTIEVDEAIQEFSSSFFSEFMMAQKDAFELHGETQSQFLNSDALYLTAYATLAVILYKNSNESYDKKWFINEVLLSKCIVYSSDHWLNAVYDGVIKTEMDLQFSNNATVPLINVIEDYTGHDIKLMRDTRRIQQILIKKSEHSLAACKACRWLLSKTWDKLFSSPSNLLDLHCKLRRIIRPKAAEVFDQAIYTLLALAKLCTMIGLEKYNQIIIKRLVEVTCPINELRTLAAQEQVDSSTERSNKWSLRKSSVLAIEAILDIGMECGLHESDSWIDIIRCTEYVWEVERYLFSTTQSQANWKFFAYSGSASENIQCLDDILSEDSSDKLSNQTSSAVLCFLISLTNKFYDRVSRELNLIALCELLQSLVVVSENSLQNASNLMQLGKCVVDPTILLAPILTISMNLSARPLIHAMKIWPKITQHIVQCACFRGNEKLNNFAIEGLGNCVVKLMTNEANGFCYNQLIFQPLQDILCAEMCSEESQEQIVSLLATFVHSHSDMIGSGWRPLFSALKSLRIECHSEKESVSVPSATITIASTALQNLLKVERMLHSLFTSTDSADPHLLQRLTSRKRTQQCIDRHTNISSLVEPLSTVFIEEPFFNNYQAVLPTDLDGFLEAPQLTLPWENYTPSMRSCAEIYLSLLESLTAVTFVCPTLLQSNLLRTIADLIIEQVDTNFGIDFGAYGLSVLVFPMLQQWMRKGISEHENNLKQAVGLFTEVVKKYVMLQREENTWVNRVLLDTFTLLTECITCASDRIARLGYACLSFLVKSCVNSFTKEQWTIVIRSLWNATDLTLVHIRLLMKYYMSGSNDPKGDLGTVRVLTIQNSIFSCEALLSAQQVFLVDEQMNFSRSSSEKKQREVILSNSDGSEERILAHELVCILTSHLHILDLIGTLLLNGIDFPVDGHTAHHLKKFDERVESDDKCNLHMLSAEDIAILFRCVDASFVVARNFDKRLGLKMLIQDLFYFPTLPNLSKQTSLTWTIHSLGMYEMVRKCPMNKEGIAQWLSSNENTKNDQYYIKQLQLYHREVCTYACKLEKKTSAEVLRHLATSHVTPQVTLINDDSTEDDLHKLLTSGKTAEIISDYKRSKTAQSLLPTAKRINPFKENYEEEQNTTNEKLILNVKILNTLDWEQNHN
ncbi:unnamed protein product [Thelazia callipaeda]|uniref:DUF1981 domain-containing protein n=1 Tax=Thelazia callipaeda TaxID=103827 RepID=A0A0N5CPZ9_THECL|nr:unnamed protein product [Thelazia callipaeda]